jgi:hypothetical protein
VWFFAGLHKLLSAAYLFETGPRMWRNTLGEMSDEQAVLLSIATAVFELSIGILAMFPAARRAVPWMAALLHGGILLSLVVQRWNTAVWPWNIALIAAAFSLYGWRNRSAEEEAAAPPEQVLAPLPWRWRLLALVVLLYPALYYVGLCDGYMAWCVYSSNTPSAHYYTAVPRSAAASTRPVPGLAAASTRRVPRPETDGLSPREGIDEAWNAADLEAALQTASGEELQFKHFAQLNVPLPPAPRLFERYFRKVARPGDVLTIDDPRPIMHWRGEGRRLFVCEKAGEIFEIETGGN